MRDVHRMKEKYEVSLDNRQIISLTVGGLVMVGAVFVLGVVVGKKLAIEEPTAPPKDLLAALDKRAGAVVPEPAVQKDASLTFQDELTKKPELPVVEAKPIPPPKAELPIVEAKPAPKPVELAVAEPAPAPKTESVPTRMQDAGALRDAIARAQKTAAPPPTSPDGNFTLQLSAYQDKAEADRFAANLRDKGYAPFIVEATVPGKGVWFRVRMGRFPSRDAAGRYLADFKRETAIDAIVTSAN
jgi:cell division septation protein DedD